MLVKAEFPDPPEIEEPAIETVTGDSKPSSSGEILTNPELTVADSGISAVRLCGFVPSRAREALREYESSRDIHDCHPRFPYASCPESSIIGNSQSSEPSFRTSR